MDMPSSGSQKFQNTDDTHTAATPGHVQKNKRVMFVSALAVVGAVAVCALLVAVYRVYAKAAHDPFTVAVATTLHLPAAKVNNQTILYSKYLNDLKAITMLRAYDQATDGPSAGLSDERLSDLVLLSLTNNILVADAAKSFGIAVEPADVAEIRKQLVTKFKTADQADAELQKRYGWTLAEWEERVAPTVILQNKLNDKISANEESRSDVRARAEEVLKKIQTGANFEDMAKQYGQDGTAAQGGDLGYFSRGEMVPQFEAAAFLLKPGEVSPDVVESPFGYHLIKVEDAKTDKVTDANGKVTVKPQIRARHILFLFPSLNQYLDDALKKASVHLYLRVHNPFVPTAPQASK